MSLQWFRPVDLVEHDELCSTKNRMHLAFHSGDGAGECHDGRGTEAATWKCQGPRFRMLFPSQHDAEAEAHQLDISQLFTLYLYPCMMVLLLHGRLFRSFLQLIIRFLRLFLSCAYHSITTNSNNPGSRKEKGIR